MRVHIQLEDWLLANPTQKEACRGDIDNNTSISNINEDRFVTFGIISGDIDSMDDIAGLKGMVGIKSVCTGFQDETKG